MTKKKQIGFGATADQDENSEEKVKEETSVEHPAWIEFESRHRPSADHRRAELLSTSEILAQLNNICTSAFYSEKKLYARMLEAGYMIHHVPGTDLYLWMVESIRPNC